MAKAQAEKETAEEKPAERGDLNNEESKKPQDGVKSTCQKDQVLYLFGRTGREKEEWFRRFLLASKLKSEVKKPPSGSKPGTQILYSSRSLLKETNQVMFCWCHSDLYKEKNSNTKDTLLLTLASHCPHLFPSWLYAFKYYFKTVHCFSVTVVTPVIFLRRNCSVSSFSDILELMPTLAVLDSVLSLPVFPPPSFLPL